MKTILVVPRETVPIQMAVINVHVHPGMNTKMEVVKVSEQWVDVVNHITYISCFFFKLAML